METIITLKEISLLIGVWVAIYGIDSWRREHTGKRQLELAEETLALFYEARDAIVSIRNPISWISEGSDIDRGESESEKNYDARKRANITFSRYNEHKVIFNKIHSVRYRFMAQIGKDESIPFDELRSIIEQILFSTRMWAKLWPRDKFNSNDEYNKHLKKLEKYEAVFWDEMSDEDQINKKLDETINKIESTCKKVISGTGTLYGFFNLSLWKG